MIKAVITKGVIVPCDPLPENWQEGTEVAVEKITGETPAQETISPTDVWMDEVEAIALHGDPEDDQRLDAALREIRLRERELARKKLGLTP
jgi:hypothetical protein